MGNRVKIGLIVTIVLLAAVLATVWVIAFSPTAVSLLPRKTSAPWWFHCR